MDRTNDPAAVVATFIAVVSAIVAVVVNVHTPGLSRGGDVIALGALLAALICPRAAWRWGTLVALSVPLSYAFNSGNKQPLQLTTETALLALIAPMVAAYVGFFVRGGGSWLGRMSRRRSARRPAYSRGTSLAGPAA